MQWWWLLSKRPGPQCISSMIILRSPWKEEKYSSSLSPLLFFCSADPRGRHHQEHTGVWDCAGGGYWPHTTGYGLLDGSRTPLHHVWEAGKKLCQSMVLWKLLAWSCYGHQNCTWSSDSEHCYYKDVLRCWSHDFSCSETIAFILGCNFWGARGRDLRGQKPKGSETTPGIALCSTRPTGYMTRSCYCICCTPHCSPPPLKLWLHLPQIRISVTLNHLAPTGVFGGAGASLRHSDQECRTLPARVQAKFRVMFLLCY